MFQWRVLLDNKKQNKQKGKKKHYLKDYGAVFQFFIQKYYTQQNNTFRCGIISIEIHDAGGFH